MICCEKKNLSVHQVPVIDDIENHENYKKKF
jgi:hypothetical protein